MNGIFPQGGLSQAYTALTRFVGGDRSATRGNQSGNSDQSFGTQIDQEIAGQVAQSSSSALSDSGATLTARPRTKDDSGFKEYFVANSSTLDPNAPRGSYVNIVV